VPPDWTDPGELAAAGNGDGSLPGQDPLPPENLPAIADLATNQPGNDLGMLPSPVSGLTTASYNQYDASAAAQVAAGLSSEGTIAGSSGTPFALDLGGSNATPINNVMDFSNFEGTALNDALGAVGTTLNDFVFAPQASTVSQQNAAANAALAQNAANNAAANTAGLDALTSSLDTSSFTTILFWAAIAYVIVIVAQRSKL